ncbi:hypothetical protein L207DRAFT_580089 [Hyaloscypha variabilis F]|uniref:2EXR domain-containing protein n=1 Tax=Hyaloscypha variabilis (strain UAMH 11265 / GT02V1 / F) TaxID=1149755 RepID=A0A2J6RXH8_HYAVF|nr:hypothetical protein L207DRAFT_580089 [Hyaloscypha variabilis F]
MAGDQTIISPPTEVAEINEVAETISEKLFLLNFELPDPEQDLTVQYPGAAATEFTCFSELALEIRLMIWRAAFPKGRKVVLKVQWKQSNYYGPPLPVTLRINRESMIETKRHYLLYFQEPEILDALDLTKAGQGFRGFYRRFCATSLRNPKLFCYSPSREQIAITSYFSD